MKLKEYLSYEKTVTRKEYLKFAAFNWIPLSGPIAILWVLIAKPHDPNGKWKKPKEWS